MVTPQRLAGLARFYYHQRIRGFDVPSEPLFGSPETTKGFEALLAKAKFYLEFGSGGSTLLAARLGIKTMTVENDAFFAKAVQKRLSSLNDKHQMIVANVGLTESWGFPLFKKPSARRHLRWARYVQQPFERIAERGDDFPDLVLVDGRFRRAAALASAMEAKLNDANTTICFDDYKERISYHSVETFLGKPRMMGRMAIFDITGHSISVTSESVREAAKDFQ